ncbi:hypothetical protein PCANC_05174 [Puccinia coronata f. sp. avenae]|uniref:Uncharacterized protein n=1 Tax=Puccinia coronata f. sp. avenae TaxID=200324 RepID=A0A2N5W388_9BASI|nr:hypothetical protein PCANC_05174 [Puccinia coronata f. sp. avenae]
MAALRNPNHPMLVNGLFEATSQSHSSAPQGNMYGVLETPSYVQCSGFDGTKNNDFKLHLSTNTALNNKLAEGSTDSLNGRLIALNDGSAPVITYTDMLSVQVRDASSIPLDLVNKTNTVGLGHVTNCAEVISHKPERSLRLEVTVAHNDWDPVNRVHRRFLAKHVVPGAKNLIKNHTLFQIGCEVQVVGSLIDFDSDSNMPIVLAMRLHEESDLAPRHPHQARGQEETGDVKFSNKAKPVEGASSPSKPPGTPFKSAQASITSTHSIDKGKGLLVEDSSEEESSADKEESLHLDAPPESPAPPPAKRGQPKKADLAAAAKKMRQV